MLFRLFDIEVVQGTVDDVPLRGERRRRKTVLLRIGRHSISRRALEWGLLLAVFQVLDACLTYIGVRLIGIRMEANGFIVELMQAYGVAPALFILKTLTLLLVFALTAYAHTRRWIRVLMMILCLVYICAAVVPWVFIISDFHAR